MLIVWWKMRNCDQMLQIVYVDDAITFKHDFTTSVSVISHYFISFKIVATILPPSLSLSDIFLIICEFDRQPKASLQYGRTFWVLSCQINLVIIIITIHYWNILVTPYVMYCYMYLSQ